MLASIAVEKSIQNICILVLNELSTSFNTQSINPLSINVAIKFSLTEHFCKIPKQNLWVTFPSSCSYRIFITRLMTTSLPLQVMYSIPLIVDTITEISEVIACLSELFFMARSPSMNLKLSFYYWVILKISRRISYYTRFLRSSGAICKALILRDNSISIIPSGLVFSLTYCSSFIL